MSNPPSTEAVEMARRLKAYEFLFKPFAPADAAPILTTFDRITSPMKVLIVDDSRPCVSSSRRSSRAACSIAILPKPPTARPHLALCRCSEFDVVFLDCNMPGLSGVATMKRLMMMQSLAEGGDDLQRAQSQRRNVKHWIAAHAPSSTSRSVRRTWIGSCMHSWLAMSDLDGEERRAGFRRGDRGQHHPPRAQGTGHIFEYLWFERPPHLRNAIVRPASACNVAPTHFAPVAERAALLQLNENRLLAA